MLRRYGAKPSPPDHRDFGVTRLLSRVSGVMPSSYYGCKPFLGPVKDQGTEGSCTGFAGTGMNEFNLRRWNPDFRGDLIEFAPVLSPNYLYARERMLDGTALSDDAGSYGRTACRVMQQFGVCPEPDMPYVDGRFSTAPDPSQDEQAATLRLGAYHRLTTVDDMKHCILSDYVFIVGFDVKESFESKTSGTGLYQPSHNEISMGGHEVLFYGYDDNVHGGAFLVRNSWSKDWGRDGDFWYAYSTAADSEITHDAFVQHYGVWK